MGEPYARMSVSAQEPRSRRSIDQLLQARAPRLVRAIRSVVLRLSPRSRLRQALVKQATRAGYDAYNRRDWPVVLAVYDRRVEIRLHHVQAMEGEYHGHDGWRRYWRLWFDAWQDSHMEPTEIIDFGQRTLFLGRIHCRARDTGLELEEPLAQLITYRRGAVVRHEEWFDHSQGLEAVGLTG